MTKFNSYIAAVSFLKREGFSKVGRSAFFHTESGEMATIVENDTGTYVLIER